MDLIVRDEGVTCYTKAPAAPRTSIVEKKDSIRWKTDLRGILKCHPHEIPERKKTSASSLSQIRNKDLGVLKMSS